MARQIADNLIYKAPKPLDERTYFETKEAMNACPDDFLYDGILAFCKEDKNWYTYSSWLPRKSTDKWYRAIINFDTTSHVTIQEIGDHGLAVKKLEYDSLGIKENPNALISYNDKYYSYDHSEEGEDPEGNPCTWRVLACRTGGPALKISTTGFQTHSVVLDVNWYYVRFADAASGGNAILTPDGALPTPIEDLVGVRYWGDDKGLYFKECVYECQKIGDDYKWIRVIDSPEPIKVEAFPEPSADYAGIKLVGLGGTNAQYQAHCVYECRLYKASSSGTESYKWVCIRGVEFYTPAYVFDLNTSKAKSYMSNFNITVINGCSMYVNCGINLAAELTSSGGTLATWKSDFKYSYVMPASNVLHRGTGWYYMGSVGNYVPGIICIDKRGVVAMGMTAVASAKSDVTIDVGGVMVNLK